MAFRHYCIFAPDGFFWAISDIIIEHNYEEYYYSLSSVNANQFLPNLGLQHTEYFSSIIVMLGYIIIST